DHLDLPSFPTRRSSDLIFSLGWSDTGTAKEAKKRRRHPHNQLLDGRRIGILITRHKFPELAVVNRRLTHLFRQFGGFGYATIQSSRTSRTARATTPGSGNLQG